ncbi:MAG: carbon-nitrogen hydrolase family protein [Granulosicoccaceae bacterium]
MIPIGPIIILVCQVDVPSTHTAADRDQHLADLQHRVASQLQNRAADLVVLPELVSIEYSIDAFDCLAELSEPLKGVSFDTWRNVSRDHHCHIVYSFVLRTDNSRYQIASAIVDPAGDLVGVYRKQYLAQFGASSEKQYFEPGNELLVFDVKGFRFATIICADVRFPELCRALTVNHNVDVILHQGAYSRDSTFFSWHSFVCTRALENQIYLVSVNRAGAEYGQSIVVPPWVDENHPSATLSEHEEHFAYMKIDKNTIDCVRARYPFLKDRKDHI